jgi:hypothetical protein
MNPQGWKQSRDYQERSKLTFHTDSDGRGSVSDAVEIRFGGLLMGEWLGLEERELASSKRGKTPEC